MPARPYQGYGGHGGYTGSRHGGRNTRGHAVGRAHSRHPSSRKKANRTRSIGHYLLGKTVGEGTFGKVKVGTHILTGERVAVKILEKDRIVEVADMKRVSREIQILKRNRHKNVIQLFEVIDTPTTLYLVMEHCDGGELFDYIVAHQRVPERNACRLFHQIVDGVEYLHQMDVSHRDLKPENLLMQSSVEGWVMKIIDFGLSNTFSKEKPLLKTACGSPCYAAPEMIAGKQYLGPKADIWSMGVILFALVCGYLPFEDNNTHILYKKILAGDFHCPRFISGEVRDLIKKILETNPEKRYSIAHIRQHPWYKMVNMPVAAPLNTEDEELDETVLAQLEALGVQRSSVREGLTNGAHNNATTAYFLLRKKLKKATEASQAKFQQQMRAQSRQSGGSHQRGAHGQHTSPRKGIKPGQAGAEQPVPKPRQAYGSHTTSNTSKPTSPASPAHAHAHAHDGRGRVYVPGQSPAQQQAAAGQARTNTGGAVNDAPAQGTGPVRGAAKPAFKYTAPPPGFNPEYAHDFHQSGNGKGKEQVHEHTTTIAVNFNGNGSNRSSSSNKGASKPGVPPLFQSSGPQQRPRVGPSNKQKMGSWGMHQPRQPRHTHQTYQASRQTQHQQQQQPEPEPESQNVASTRAKAHRSSDSVAVSQTARERGTSQGNYQQQQQHAQQQHVGHGHGARNVVRARSNGSGVTQSAREAGSAGTSGRRPPSKPTPPVGGGPRRPSYSGRNVQQPSSSGRSVTKLHPLGAAHGSGGGHSGGRVPPRSKTPPATMYRGRYPPTQQQHGGGQRHRPPRARSQQGHRPGGPTAALIAGATHGRRPILRPKAAEAFS